MLTRLDLAVAGQRLARSRSHAAELIRAGQVQVDGVVVTRPATPTTDVAEISVRTDPWVSRAAHKLLGALDDSGIPVPSRVLDAGASTGGFTQVVLSRGAERVYAVDVGHDQLAAVLRDDPRVTNLEGLNLRDLTVAHVDGQAVDLVVGDVSFISLRLILAPLLAVLKPSGTALLMVKPQFEVGRQLLGSGGVVRSPELRHQAVQDVIGEAATHGWSARWRGVARLRKARATWSSLSPSSASRCPRFEIVPDCVVVRTGR